VRGRSAGVRGLSVIDESERADLKAATTMATKLAKTFAEFASAWCMAA